MMLIECLVSVQMRVGKAERIQLHHKCVRESAMLPRVVRLCDYMVVEAIVEATLCSLEALVAVLQDPNKARGVFQCQLFFCDDGGFSYLPSNLTVEDQMHAFITATLEVRRPAALDLNVHNIHNIVMPVVRACRSDFVTTLSELSVKLIAVAQRIMRWHVLCLQGPDASLQMYWAGSA
jgi:hypothetical protein